jgi:hypothetical protein
MSRSKHTRPARIIAADRVSTPRGKRGSEDPSDAHRILIVLKELGIETSVLGDSKQDSAATSGITGAGAATTLPRISIQRPRRGFSHPANRSLIRKILMHFGELSWYGVREICLTQNPSAVDENKLIFGCLSIPGKILLYEQPHPPWLLTGRLRADQLALLESAGASIEVSSDGTRSKVDWPDDTLSRFMLFEVLMHEIGHHIIQQFKGKREAQVLRRKDHEALALAFARRCRQSYLGGRSDEISASG